MNENIVILTLTFVNSSVILVANPHKGRKQHSEKVQRHWQLYVVTDSSIPIPLFISTLFKCFRTCLGGILCQHFLLLFYPMSLQPASSLASSIFFTNNCIHRNRHQGILRYKINDSLSNVCIIQEYNIYISDHYQTELHISILWPIIYLLLFYCRDSSVKLPLLACIGNFNYLLRKHAWYG